MMLIHRQEHSSAAIGILSPHYSVCPHKRAGGAPLPVKGLAVLLALDSSLAPSGRAVFFGS
jgi:hypothetical protein